MPITPVPITNTGNANIYPSVLVDEDTANYVTVEIDKDLAPATLLEITLDGSFLLRAQTLLMADGTNDEKTVVTRWPLFWFDVYISAAPSAGIDDYDARSDTFGPLEHLTVMQPNDGQIGFWSQVADNWPDKVQPAAMTIDTTTITIDDSGVLDLFTGASGQVTVYIKPRKSAVVQAVDGEEYDTPDQSVVLTETFEGFLGHATADITR